MRALSITCVGALSFIATAPAHASEQTVAGWTISPSENKGTCQMSAAFHGGTFLIFRYDPRDEGYFVYAANANWKSLVNKKEYSVNYILSTGEWEDDETVAYNDTGKMPALYSAFKKGFGAELMISNGMIIKNGDTVIDRLSLAGTSKAVPELIRCAYKEFKKTNYDPFK